MRRAGEICGRGFVFFPGQGRELKLPPWYSFFARVSGSPEARNVFLGGREEAQQALGRKTRAKQARTSFVPFRTWAVTTTTTLWSAETKKQKKNTIT